MFIKLGKLEDEHVNFASCLHSAVIWISLKTCALEIQIQRAGKNEAFFAFVFAFAFAIMKLAIEFSSHLQRRF
jgi:hypothetical protein